MEEVCDAIERMLRQEVSHYHCDDYFVPPRQRRQHSDEPVRSPLHLIAECANLVTDGPPVTPSLLDTQFEQELYQQSPTTTVMQCRRSSLQDLLSSSESSSRCSVTAATGSLPESLAHQQGEQSCLAIWRHQMFGWARVLTASFNLNHDVVGIAFDILDRFMSKEVEASVGEDAPITREDFQLFAMVSLYMAVKTTCSDQKISVEGLIDMSRGCFSADDICSTERDILDALNWRVNPPTVLAFCHLFHQLFPTECMEASTCHVDFNASIHCISDLAIADSYFVSKPKSAVALATTLLAARREGVPIHVSEQFISNLQGLVTVDGPEFEAIFRRLESLC